MAGYVQPSNIPRVGNASQGGVDEILIRNSGRDPMWVEQAVLVAVNGVPVGQVGTLVLNATRAFVAMTLNADAQAADCVFRLWGSPTRQQVTNNAMPSSSWFVVADSVTTLDTLTGWPGWIDRFDVGGLERLYVEVTSMAAVGAPSITVYVGPSGVDE